MCKCPIYISKHLQNTMYITQNQHQVKSSSSSDRSTYLDNISCSCCESVSCVFTKFKASRCNASASESSVTIDWNSLWCIGNYRNWLVWFGDKRIYRICWHRGGRDNHDIHDHFGISLGILLFCYGMSRCGESTYAASLLYSGFGQC